MRLTLAVSVDAVFACICQYVASKQQTLSIVDTVTTVPSFRSFIKSTVHLQVNYKCVLGGSALLKTRPPGSGFTSASIAVASAMHMPASVTLTTL